MRTLWTALILFFSACGSETKASGTADDSAQKACEHARDVTIEMVEGMVKPSQLNAPDPVMRQTIQLEMQARTERIRSKFVERCLAVMPGQAACISRIDEFATAARETRADHSKCGPFTPDSQRCHGAADALMQERIGECGEVLEGILRAIGEPPRAPYEAKRVEEKKAEAKVDTKF